MALALFYLLLLQMVFQSAFVVDCVIIIFFCGRFSNQLHNDCFVMFIFSMTLWIVLFPRVANCFPSTFVVNCVIIPFLHDIFHPSPHNDCFVRCIIQCMTMDCSSSMVANGYPYTFVVDCVNTFFGGAFPSIVFIAKLVCLVHIAVNCFVTIFPNDCHLQ